eukprot:m51a1_g11840 hypothetical protein (271) ;mRNA; f:458375-461071
MDDLRCLFCKGKGCKYEDYTRWLTYENTRNAVEGVYSNWVTDTVLAMARPSTRAIREHSIIEQFKDYKPDDFTAADIEFYNLGWKDMGVPPLELAIDIVQLMAGVTDRGLKVAVHCHAGRVKHVRLRRPGALQTTKQVQIVHDFAHFLHELRCAYPSRSADDAARRQRRALHGPETLRLRALPKVVDALCTRISELVPQSGGTLPPLSQRGYLPPIDKPSSQRTSSSMQGYDAKLFEKIEEIKWNADLLTYSSFVKLMAPSADSSVIERE